MRGQWPSGWEDPEDEELDTEEPDEGTEVRLSEVAAFLATVPAPVLPGAIESRIVAALAAESAARAADLTTDPAAGSPGTDRSRTLGPAPARSRVRRFRRLRPAQVSGALLACLLFVGLGFAISLSHGPSSSSSSAASAPQAAASPTAGGEKGYSSSAGGAAGPQFLAGSPVIVVIQSGTTYQGATLGGQVRSAIQAVHADKRIPAATVPSASSSSAAAAASSAPASAAGSASATPASSAAAASNGSAVVGTGNVLRGCVLNLTDGVAPRLVDRASYQGTPAYVIATASQV